MEGDPEVDPLLASRDEGRGEPSELADNGKADEKELPKETVVAEKEPTIDEEMGENLPRSSPRVEEEWKTSDFYQVKSNVPTRFNHPGEG